MNYSSIVCCRHDVNLNLLGYTKQKVDQNPCWNKVNVLQIQASITDKLSNTPRNLCRCENFVLQTSLLRETVRPKEVKTDKLVSHTYYAGSIWIGRLRFKGGKVVKIIRKGPAAVWSRMQAFIAHKSQNFCNIKALDL